MVKFKIKISNSKRLAYIPKEVVESLGLKLVMIPGMKAAVLYPEDADMEKVVKSVENILEELKINI
jgi:hypothetical protein